MAMVPRFEFDEAKSCANRSKHGIDFRQAQALWADDRLVQAAARTQGELRYVVIGVIDSTHWAAVFTLRGEAVRLMSVRRARRREVEIYEDE